MRRIPRISFIIHAVLPLILFFSTGIYPDNAIIASENKQAQADEEDWPKTKAEAVARIVKNLSEEDKQKLKFLNKKELNRYHRGWGAGIRNSFGLWRGNKELLRSLGDENMHPDFASLLIIRGVWREIRNTCEEKDDFNRLDNLLADISISDFSMNGKPIGEVTEHLNRKINIYLADRGMQPDSLSILLTENSNHKARVSHGFEKSASLGEVLDLIAWPGKNKYRYELPNVIRINYESSIYHENIEPIHYFTESWNGKKFSVTSVRYGKFRRTDTDYFKLFWTLPSNQSMMTVPDAFKLAKKLLPNGTNLSEIILLRIERRMDNGRPGWKYTIETLARDGKRALNTRDYYDMYLDSWVDDKRFLSGVSYDDFENVPKWANVEEQAPPLNISSAIHAARNVLSQYTNQVEKMEFTDIQLIKYGYGHWLYNVTFEGPKKKLSRKNRIMFPVLLSGKVVPPKPGS